jgi:hypothetical protein
VPAVFLSEHVAKVWMLVRGADLASTMSRYLVDRVSGLANVQAKRQAAIILFTAGPPRNSAATPGQARLRASRGETVVRLCGVGLGALVESLTALDATEPTRTGLVFHLAPALKAAVPLDALGLGG